ncbi:MAG: hypothetical protein IH974_06875 [Myxococcales bacterium]|nr:hypothetical protein [Myxococcales bacterium]
MPEVDILLTTAELAVAFAGFASLVTILGRRSSRADPRIVAMRFRGMLTNSLLVVAFSMIPLVLFRYGLRESVVWRLSSALLALAGGINFLALLLHARPLFREAVPISSLRRVVTFGLIGLAEVVLVLNASGVTGRIASAAYLTGLLLFLCIAGFAAAWLFLAVLEEPNS